MKFKVGDRASARMYSGESLFGTITDVFSGDVYRFTPDPDNERSFLTGCAKLSRLVLKKKSRTFWVNLYPGYTSVVLHDTKKDADDNAIGNRIECLKLVEVRRKKKTKE